ncbi:hypothetical protein [Nonomuraea sp. NPDC003804]|uniref:hypothetical protein n=1 Tax=Nonomuraea sp. NPDC003804 TaxID=3154547 RepID=UPI0033BDEED0
MRSSTAEIRRLFLHAGHFQFYLQDAETYGDAIEDGDDDGDPWTEEASQSLRIGVETASIAVGTAREDWVLMTLRMHGSPPVVTTSPPEVTGRSAPRPPPSVTVTVRSAGCARRG